VFKVMHAMFGDAVRGGLIAGNPCAMVRAPRRPPVQLCVPSEDEQRQIMRLATGTMLEAYVAFLIGTGAREGDASACGGRAWTSRPAP
jgi:hypothetical protein